MLYRHTILAAFAISLMVSLGLLVSRFDWLCVPALLAGWYAADLASGLVHLSLDYRPCPPGRGLAEIFFYKGSRESEEYLALRAACMARLTPFQRIAYDFKTHHPRPDALGRRTLWTQIGPTLIIAALPAALALNAAAILGHAPGWLIAFGVTLVTGSGLAQYFHGSLHRNPAPRPVRALRRMGLLMTPAAHQLHHDTLQRDFATNCGWSNPVINRVFRLAHAHGWISDAGLVPPA